MKLLALDTSTDSMSIAVMRDDVRTAAGAAQCWEHSAAGGAFTSSALIPAITQLLAQAELRLAELDAIVFGQGPGSFTGLRTTCAVAQGLAFGAGVRVLPVDTLLAVAEEARWQHAARETTWRVLVLLDARMDELYGAHYLFESTDAPRAQTASGTGGVWTQLEDDRLLKPEAVTLGASQAMAGNVFAAYGERLPINIDTERHTPTPRWSVLPTASALLRLAPALLRAGLAIDPAHALPRYIRDKVAQTTAERAALQAAL